MTVFERKIQSRLLGVAALVLTNAVFFTPVHAAFISTSTHATSLYLADPQCVDKTDQNASAKLGDVSLSSTSCSAQTDTRSSEQLVQARAEFGHLGVNAQSNYSTGASPAGQVTASSRSTAIFSDEIEVSGSGSNTPILDGFVRLIFDIEGSLTLDSPFDAFSFGEFARISLQVKDVGSGPGRGLTYLDFKQELTFSGLTKSGNLIADMDILDGFIRPIVTFGAEVSCGAATSNPGKDCMAVASFFNSATLLQSQVFDANGNLISDAVMRSESGFDYLQASTSTPSIPEPSTMLLLTFGLGALGCSAWRRHRPKQAC